MERVHPFARVAFAGDFNRQAMADLQAGSVFARQTQALDQEVAAAVRPVEHRAGFAHRSAHAFGLYQRNLALAAGLGSREAATKIALHTFGDGDGDVIECLHRPFWSVVAGYPCEATGAHGEPIISTLTFVIPRKRGPRRRYGLIRATGSPLPAFGSASQPRE